METPQVGPFWVPSLQAHVSEVAEHLYPKSSQPRPDMPTAFLFGMHGEAVGMTGGDQVLHRATYTVCVCVREKK